MVVLLVVVIHNVCVIMVDVAVVVVKVEGVVMVILGQAVVLQVVEVAQWGDYHPYGSSVQYEEVRSAF